MKKINESTNQPLSQQMNESIKSPNFLKHLNFNTKTTLTPPRDHRQIIYLMKYLTGENSRKRA